MPARGSQDGWAAPPLDRLARGLRAAEPRIRATADRLRQWCDRPRAVVLAVAAGFAAVVMIIICGGRAGPVAGTWPLTRWFGLLHVPSATSPSRSGPRLLLFAVVVLALAWLVIHRAARERRLTVAALWRVAGLWTLPLLIAPPLFSGDIYSYTAQGLLQTRGLDPYVVGPSALGPTSALLAVDPRWQDSPAPYGPLALLVERGAALVSGGDAVATLVILRLIVQLALVGCAIVAVRAVSPPQQPATLSYLLLSPLVLLQISSAGHLESLLMLGVLLAVVAAQRQHWTLAIAAATAAFAVKASVLPAVAAIGWFHATLPTSRRERVRVVRADLLVALVTYGVVALLVPDSWGWIRGLGTPGQAVTSDAPSTIVVRLLTDLPGAIALRTDPAFLTVSRNLGMLLAAIIGCSLIATHRSRPLAATVGFALLAVGVLGPVLYPWYLFWGIAPLILLAGRYQRLLTLVMCLGPLLALPGLTGFPDIVLGFGAAAILVGAEWLVHFPAEENTSEELPKVGREAIPAG